MTININIPVTASLGKRKLQSLSNLPKANMSVTLFQSLQLESGANIWISDNQDRKFGIVIDNDQLKELHDAISKHLKAMEELLKK